MRIGQKGIKIIIAFMLVLSVVATGIIVAVPVYAANEQPVTITVKASVVEYMTETRLGGAEMQLLSTDGEVLESWTSEFGKPHVIQHPLVLNKYYILHQATPASPYDEQWASGEDYHSINCSMGRDTAFQVVNKGGKQTVSYRYNENTIFSKGYRLTKKDSENDEAVVIDYRTRTLEFGKEVLGNAGDPDEYFEVILDIRYGIPGQVMNVDLSNADSQKNPSSVTIPADGVLKASFWLKDGQSIIIDGFPLFNAGYYELRENKETMDQEGYITRILDAETMTNDSEALFLLIQGSGRLSQGPSETITAHGFFIPDGFMRGVETLLPGQVAHAAGESDTTDPAFQYEVPEHAIEMMTGYASEELFAVEDPVVDTESLKNPLLEYLGCTHTDYFTIDDTLSNGADTTRTASKFGYIPNSADMITKINGVYGDAKVLFINRRDAVPVEKQNEEGELLPGSDLQILDASGEVIHEFTSSDKPAMIVGLAPGDYTLHEVSAPSGYLTTEDVSFTVENLQTVETVTMTDPKDPTKPVEPTEPTEPTEPEAKVPATEDHALFLLPTAMLIVSGAAVTLALRRRQNNR